MSTEQAKNKRLTRKLGFRDGVLDQIGDLLDHLIIPDFLTNVNCISTQFHAGVPTRNDRRLPPILSVLSRSPVDLRMQVDVGNLNRMLERLSQSELLLKWKDITNALVIDGLALELYQELDSQTGYECSVVTDARQSGHQNPEGPRHGPLSNKRNACANDTEPDMAVEELVDTDENASNPGSDESESDDDLFYKLVVPPDLIKEAADVPQHQHASSQLTFEMAFAQERPLAGRSKSFEHEEHTNHLADDLVMTPIMSPSPLSTPSSELEEGPLDGATEHNRVRLSNGQDVVEDESSSMTTPSASSSRCRQPSQELHGLQLSKKQNLTPIEISVAADRLINPEVVSYFLSHCDSIYDCWISYLARQPRRIDVTIESSVVAAIQRVNELREDKHSSRLLLRFAYLQLTWEIEAYKTVAATDRIEGRSKRSRGQRDSTIALDLYLAAEQRISKKARNAVTTDCRSGRRWAALVGRSPLLIFVFPEAADTIVYVAPPFPVVPDSQLRRQNGSMTESTLQALIHLIEQNHPGLVRVLNEIGALAGLFSTGITPIRPCIEDFVVRTHQLFSSLPQIIPAESDTIMAGT